MPSKSKQQYKQYAINTIEDACAVLKGLIVPVILDMEKFEQYSKEAQEILIKYKNVEEIPADVYDSVHDKLLYQQRELLRFIADHQTSSFSYIDVRKKFEKQGFLKRKLSTRSSETLNELLELRNWSFHNVQSMFVADIELAKRSIPPELQGIAEIKPMLNPIVIRKVKSYKREMLEGFVHHNSVRLEQFKVVLSDMKEDYQEMFSLLTLEPIHFLGNQVRFKLPGTPPDPNTGPAIAIEWNTHFLAPRQSAGPCFRLLKHEIFKAPRMAQYSNANAPFLIQQRIHFGKVVVHFGELHAGVCIQYGINGHPALQHHEQHSGAVLATGQTDGMVIFCLVHFNLL